MNSALVLVIGVAAALIAEAIRQAAARAQESRLRPVPIKNPSGKTESTSESSETTTP